MVVIGGLLSNFNNLKGVVKLLKILMLSLGTKDRENYGGINT